jgi:hypothetical protein
MALAAAILGLAVVPAVASAGAAIPLGTPPFVAPGGKIYWGGQGGYSQADIMDFERQSEKHPAVFNYFISWNASDSAFHWLSFRLADARAQNTAAMLSVAPEDTGLTPRALAQGRGDDFLVGLTKLLADHGQVTFLRPLSEMNNGNNSYAPYNLDGSSRGPAYSVRQFLRAWRRIALITRGGQIAAMNRTLRRLGMPPVRTRESMLRRTLVALMWVPLTFGNPEIPKNHPRFFWPGSRWVDWVGTTWYSRYKATRAIVRFYRYILWRRKPFAFAEWGIWGRDDPAFVRQFFRFLRFHRRVRMAVYYQSAQLRPEFRLSTHPRARLQLRRELRWSRMTGMPPPFIPL